MSPPGPPAGEPALDLEVPATLDAVDRAVERVQLEVSALGPGTDPFAFLLVLREALLNAVCHGCGRNPALRARVWVWLDGALAHARVWDPGPGFDWEAEAFRPRSETEENGRGLQILRRLAAAVEYRGPAYGLYLCCRLDRPDQAERPR